MDRLRSLGRVVTGPVALRRWAVATLVANIVIVLTGGIVRLTGSGLGCPTWPQCTDASYVTHPALGVHGVIEFTNRMLTFALVAIAALTLVTAWRVRVGGRSRPDLGLLAAMLAFGIPLQGVVGGISVLMRLNPWVVSLHLLISLALIAVSVAFVRRTRSVPGRPVVGARLLLPRLALVGMALVVWLGTVVTGSGPHSGDEHASRNGVDSALVAHAHAAAVYGVIAVTVACVVLLRSRAAVALLLVELLQGAIGFLQYANGLPVPLVALHLLGASAAVALAANLALSVSRAQPAAGQPAATPAESLVSR